MQEDVSDMPPQRTRTRRGAVSASVMTEEQATSYVKKVRVYIYNYYYPCIFTQYKYMYVLYSV